MTTDNSGSVLNSVDPSVFSTRKFADSAAQIIRQMILTNEVKPGQRLNELSLSQQLGISRSPVREAMQSLAGEGLVHFIPGRGAFVVELGVETVRNLGQIRSALESLAARLAAEAASDEQVEAIVAVHRSTAEEDGAGGPSFTNDHDLHKAILEASGNPRLVEMAGLVSAQFRLARLRSAHQSQRAHEAFHEHEAVVDAISRRDADAAATAMRTHLDSALANVLRLVEQAEATD